MAQQGKIIKLNGLLEYEVKQNDYIIIIKRDKQ